MDVCAPLKVQRKYNSTNKQEGMLDQGWKSTYEDRVYKDGNKIHAALCDGRLVQLKDSLGRTKQYRYEDGLLSDVVHMEGVNSRIKFR